MIVYPKVYVVANDSETTTVHHGKANTLGNVLLLLLSL